VVVYNSIITGSKLETGSYVGPYSYVRAGSRIGAHARIGNSVEVKNSCIGAYSKALNNALIVDSDVGENVSYGSGCITANFDGTVQSRTKIGENSFIGSNSNLVAPVQISENTYIAAGSTITDDVPPYAMAIARSRQLVKDDWVLKKNRVRMR
jgi:bifunctional UDP-N-acetylglucosamine pyrophosphorylase/glucosamine-1-phosphate N-acetyltransferase